MRGISGANRAWRKEAARRRAETEGRFIPSRWAGGAASVLLHVWLDQGNTLMSSPVTVKGALVASSPIAAVPTASPIALTTYANGLAYGKLYDANGSLLSPLVWIVNGAVTIDGDTIAGGLTTAAPGGNDYEVMNVHQIPITGGGGLTAPVYQLYRA